MLTRIKESIEIYREEVWLEKMQGGSNYIVRCIMNEIEHHGSWGGTKPNKTGVRLLVKLWNAKFIFDLVVFAVTGRTPIEWEHNHG